MPHSTRNRWLIDIGLGVGLVLVLVVIAASEPRTPRKSSPTSREVAAVPKLSPSFATPKANPEPAKPDPKSRDAASVPDKPVERVPIAPVENEPRVPIKPAENEERIPVQPPENQNVVPLKPGENQVEFLGVKARGKRFCIIADNSGSMYGASISDLRAELLKTLKDFDKGGEFYIYCFNDVAEPMPHHTWLKAASPETAKIRNWIESIEPKGGTDPRTAFDAAFRLSPPPDIIYFMTDGIIPRGVPDQVERLNKGEPKVVVHTIMFGDGWFSESGERLLKTIAEQSGGTFSRRGISGSSTGFGTALATAGVCGTCCVGGLALMVLGIIYKVLFKKKSAGWRRRVGRRGRP